jgi:sugar-specific transcriptional regulator TrmB
MTKVQDYLQNLGLSEVEAKVYTGLLEHGPSTVMELAKHLQMKRITVHFNVENLITKGLIAQTKQGTRRKVVAERPDKLITLLENREHKIYKMKEEFPEVLKNILHLQPKNKPLSSDVEVRYYEGEEGFRQVSQRSIEHGKDEILFLSNLDEWYSVYTEDYDKNIYIPKRLEKNLSLKILSFQTEKTETMKKEDPDLLREIRFLSPEYKFSTTMMIYGNEVSLMLSKEPYTSILIQDVEFFNTFKAIFYLLWDMFR